MTDRELFRQALEALDNISTLMRDPEDMMIADVDIVLEAATALRERLAQPEQYQRPQMRRATREEKIDRPGVYWVPVEQPEQKRPQNCGTSYCSCVECVMEPVGVKFPRDASGGWTIDPAFLLRVKHSIDPETGGDFTPDMEEIETTLLALEVIPSSLYTTPQPNTIANSEAIPKQISEQEPVAWAAVTENGKLFKAASTQEGAQRKANQQQEKFGEAWRPLRVAPLYTTPLRCPNCASLEEQNTELDAKLAGREWVRLTGEEIDEAHDTTLSFHGFARAIEAKLREKNA